MMVKLLFPLLFALAISLLSISPAASVEDEFAEFDELTPGEPSPQKPETQKPVPHQETAQQTKTTPTTSSAESQPEPTGGSSGDDLVADTTDAEEAEQDQGERKKKRPELQLVDAPLPTRMHPWQSYYVEISFIIATFLYFVNFFLGSGKNDKIAQQWYEQTREILKQQFSLVGGAPQLEPQQKDDDREANLAAEKMKKQRGLIKSNESMYTLWNSGRVGMDGLLVEISLLKRQDLFSMALNMIKPSKDIMILRFLLNQDGYENFVFCLAHKKFASTLARDTIDIQTFCPKKKPVSQYGIETERLFVLSELSDVVSFILDHKATSSFIKKYEDSINYVHITDQYSTNFSEDAQPAQRLANPKRMATFSFNFPSSPEEGAEFILMALSLLDRLRRFKLAKDSKQKSEKNRQKIADILQKTAFNLRQEAAQAKKEELRRLEKERIYNEDDPEKQRRWEKKEAKRELKKSKSRVKQLKVKSM